MTSSECTLPTQLSQPAKVSAKRAYLIVLVLASVFYVISCAPGLLWQDSGMFQSRIMHNDIQGDLGLALSHPLYIILGMVVKVFPLGDPFYKINLISAFAGAFTIANLFLLIYLWLGRLFPAVISAITLAVAHTFWQHCAIAEVYTLYTATFLAELVCLLQYCRTKRVGYLYLLGLFKGLSIANHMWAIIPLLCYDIFFLILLIKKEIKIRDFAVIVACWCLGALPYEYLIIQQLWLGASWSDTLHSVFFGHSYASAVTSTSLSLRVVKENFLFIFMNFPTPILLLSIPGIIYLRRLSPRPAFGYIVGALTILFFLFAFRYQVPDRYAFFLPFYCLTAILIGLGCQVIITRYVGRVVMVLIVIAALLPIPVYAVLPAAARCCNLSLGLKRNIPYRDEYKYFLQPWQTGYTGPERFAREAFDTVSSNAVIFADSTTDDPLRLFQQASGRWDDVLVITSLNELDTPIDNAQQLREFLRDRSMYVVSPVESYCPALLLDEDNFTLQKRGVLYEVLPAE